jgi:uncharacterized membrane protein
LGHTYCSGAGGSGGGELKPDKLTFAVVWAYIAVALIGKLAYGRTLGELSPPALIYALLFTVIMMASYELWKPQKPVRWVYAVVAILLLIPLGWNYLLAGTAVMGLTLWLFRKPLMEERRRRLGILGGISAAALAGYGIIAFGIPLLHPWLRFTEASLPFLLAGDVLIVAIGVYPSPWLLFLGLGIATVGTSRTVGIGVLMAYTVATAYREELSMEKLARRKGLVAVVLILFLAMLAARYAVTKFLYPEWHLGPVGTVFYRVASTYTVYERLMEMGMPLGRHVLLFQSDPTGYVGELFGRNVGYTYSLFGEPAYDFGILGIAEAAAVGILLKDAGRNALTGVFAFTLLVLMTEIGIEGVFLAALAYAAFLGLTMEVDVWKRGH